MSGKVSSVTENSKRKNKQIYSAWLPLNLRKKGTFLKKKYILQYGHILPEEPLPELELRHLKMCFAHFCS